MVHVNDSTCLDEAHVAVRRRRRLRPRRPRGRRGEPRGVHRDALDQRPARPGRVPVLMPRPRCADRRRRAVRRRRGEAARGGRASGSPCSSRATGPTTRKARPEAADFDITATRDWAWDPNARNGAGGLPDRRLGVRHHRADVERRRRRHDRLRRAVAAQHAVGLPRALARRRRGRLAAHLRGARALLRARGEGLRDLGRRRTTRRSRPARGRRCRRCRSGRAGRKVAHAHNELGWHWWPAPNAIATRSVRRAQPVRAARRVPEGVHATAPRATVDITHWPVAQRAGVELITKATVREITVGARRPRDRRRLPRRRGRRAPRSAPAWSSSPPTASGRRGCCSCPAGRRGPGELVAASSASG